jgi:hypothetical protein
MNQEKVAGKSQSGHDMMLKGGNRYDSCVLTRLTEVLGRSDLPTSGACELAKCNDRLEWSEIVSRDAPLGCECPIFARG